MQPESSSYSSIPCFASAPPHSCSIISHEGRKDAKIQILLRKTLSFRTVLLEIAYLSDSPSHSSGSTSNPAGYQRQCASWTQPCLS